MSVKQISVFIENKKGKLAEATRYIAEHDVNLRALSRGSRRYHWNYMGGNVYFCEKCQKR